jgi:hypothetical protein
VKISNGDKRIQLRPSYLMERLQIDTEIPGGKTKSVPFESKWNAN